MDRKALSLGEIIRRQRELNALSMREFARTVGISNPYLSQIERGLRAPSEQVLESIARSLQTSADALYEQAGVTPGDDDGESQTVAAIEADAALTPSQRKALIQVYDAFVAQGDRRPARRRRRPREDAADADAGGAESD